MIRAVAVVACLLTVCITATSAFIRHSQAGVGCAAWPSCYRGAVATRFDASPAAPEATGSRAVAPATREARGVRIARALHRVSATAVGVLVLVIAAFGWGRMRGSTRLVVSLALADTVILAWLGRYTPHDLPLVTIGNLVGGLALVAALAWIASAPPTPTLSMARRARTADPLADSKAAPPAFVALALLATLSWIGTMIGAYGAIDACVMPVCLDGARLDLSTLDPTKPPEAIEAGVARGLHLTHRVVGAAFALATLLVAWRVRRAAMLASGLAGGTVVQWLLGAATALGVAPLLTTTLHNVVAALLAVLLARAASRAMVTIFVPGRTASA